MKKDRILIVEDQDNLRETWKMILNTFNVNPFMAENGEKAVEILKTEDIAIVVTDLQMPVQDGYYVLDYLKSHTKNIITWVCTGQLIPNPPLTNYTVHKTILKPFNMILESKELIALLQSQG